MEKDIDRIPKNAETDIVIRVDDFGGRRGLTIREFVRSERYTGFTKAGTRVPADQFKAFRDAINKIDEKELAEEVQEAAQQTIAENEKKDNAEQTEAPKEEPKSGQESPGKSQGDLPEEKVM